MTTMDTIDIVIGILVLLLQFLLLFLFSGLKKSRDTEKGFNRLDEQLSKTEQLLREELRYFRESESSQARQNREELTKALSEFRTEHREVLKNLTEQNVQAISSFQKNFSENTEHSNRVMREKLGELTLKQQELLQSTEKKLEEMRNTVDEKLQKTLNERIGQSFELVSKQLENVQKGLGEMQNLAQDVGGLKRALSNVKIRGTIGEVQLGMRLEELLAPDQYAVNIRTKSQGNEVVEFAIKLPGKEDENSCVHLPVDAKFPKDTYEQLLEAYDSADPARIEAASKNIEQTIKTMAKDIRDKYLDPPHTTDFGIMFLPFESVYSEVVRRASLMEQLQRDYHVIVTGPTTFAAILNSLQMGFRTLAIQKRSSEVWRILGAVKTEFEKFGGMLEKAQKNIQTANNQLEEVMGKRTRAIKRQLRSVESLPSTEADELLLPDE